MNTTFLGQSEVIKRQGLLLLVSEQSGLAINHTELYETILSSHNVQYQNGRMSHEVAYEVMEESQDILLE